MAQIVFVGTYTEPILFGTGEVFHGKGRGLYRYGFQDGTLERLDHIALRNPSYFCINRPAGRIYVVNELKSLDGEQGGGLTQLRYDGGRLCVERQWGTGGADPCHVALSPDGSVISAANFAAGSTAVFPLDAAGNVLAGRQLFRHQGHGSDPVRQRGPHAHSSIFATDGLMYVPDLGLDRVIAYRCQNGSVVPAPERDLCLAPGSGPRTGVFSADGMRLYILNELASQVAMFVRREGGLRLAQTVSTLPPDCRCSNLGADLQLAPDGRTLYASNRGHDSICVLRIEQDGRLTPLQWIVCAGKTPRSFCLDPSGKYLLAGCQDSDIIETFSIMPDGRLKSVSTTPVPSPVCIRFWPEPDSAVAPDQGGRL